MKKTLASALSVVVVVSMLSGCVTSARKNPIASRPKGSTEDQMKNGITVNDQKYTRIDDYDKLPKEIQRVIDERKEKGEVLVIKGQDGAQYVYISLGMRGSGGYSIDLLHVEDVEGRISIVYQEVTPKPGQMVTEAITYPWVVLKIDSALPIDVKEEKAQQSTKPQEPVPSSPIDYKVIQDDHLNESMAKLVEQAKTQRGYMILQQNVLMISPGEKPSSGYGIEVAGVQKSGDKIIIKIKEPKPAPDQIVLTVITYPYVVINVDTSLPIEIVDEGGNLLPKIKLTDR